MRVEYPTNNLENRLDAIEKLFATVSLSSAVEVGYIMKHGDFTNKLNSKKSTVDILLRDFRVPKKFVYYSLIATSVDERMFYYFDIGVDFMLSYLSKEEKNILINEANSGMDSMCWGVGKFKEYVANNRFDFPDEYIGVMLG